MLPAVTLLDMTFWEYTSTGLALLRTRPTHSATYGDHLPQCTGLTEYPADDTVKSSINSNVLEITQVSRDQMGVYMCIASNGVPPPALKKLKLEVAFPPLIKIRNQMVGTVNGSYAVLECFVEAHPPAVNFWLHGESRHLENNWKYKIEQIDDGYRTHMILNITRVEPLDYGLYRCVSKNEKGKTLGIFTVFGKNLFD
ncbi:lachesin [Trichonephila clavipes]|nr:lachesin [Trichonephila clavipes]